MASLRELITHWTFEVSEEPLERIERHIETLKSGLELLGAYEIVKGLFELTESMGGFADELHQSAVAAGITTDALQGLQLAAGTAGVSGDEMSMAIARLSKQLYAARKGSTEAQAAFAEAGFTQDQVQNLRSGADAFLVLSDHIKGLQDPVEKQAVAMQLLGRGGAKMVGFMDEGGAAIDRTAKSAKGLGAVLGEQDIDALKEMKDALEIIEKVVKVFTAQIAANFAPGIQTATELFLKFFNANRQFILAMAKDWAHDFLYAAGAVTAAVQIVAQMFINFAKAHPQLVRAVGDVAVALGLVTAALWVGGKAASIFKGAIWLVGRAIAVVFSPAVATVLALVAAFTAGYLIGDALYQMFDGKDFKDTKLGKALAWLKSLSGKALAVLGFKQEDLAEVPTMDEAKAQAEAMPLRPVGQTGEILQPETGMQKLLRLTGFDGAASGDGGTTGIADLHKLLSSAMSLGQPPASQGMAAGGDAWQQLSISAPITLNIDGKTDNPEQLGSRVQAAVKASIQDIHRQAQRSLVPGLEY